MEEIIVIKDLSIKFKNENRIITATDKINFNVYKNEILGIVGESGSGKSVTVMAMLNLIANNGTIEGEIFFENKNIFHKNKKELEKYRSKNFGMIFQDTWASFDPIYNIEKTFLETLKANNPKISKKEAREISVNALKEVSIDNPEKRLKNFPHQFSGGMLQRVMIALALSTNPKILIADEPTTALDVTIQAQIIKLILEIKKKRDITIIFISHDLELVSSISDRTIVMYAGSILESGDSKKIYYTPKSPYTYGLLKSKPDFNKHYTQEELYTIKGNFNNSESNFKGCPFFDRCEFVFDRCKYEKPKLNNIDNQYFSCFLNRGIKNG